MGNNGPPPGQTAAPPGEVAGVLRVIASEAMRGAIERHYGVRLPFHNCHRAAACPPEATRAHPDFATAGPRSSISPPNWPAADRWRLAGAAARGGHNGAMTSLAYQGAEYW
jgi:hypothetical protein